MTDQPDPAPQPKPAALDETALEQVSGGLPAVQKVREAANRLQTTQTGSQLTSN